MELGGRDGANRYTCTAVASQGAVVTVAEVTVSQERLKATEGLSTGPPASKRKDPENVFREVFGSSVRAITGVFRGSGINSAVKSPPRRRRPDNDGKLAGKRHFGSKKELELQPASARDFGAKCAVSLSPPPARGESCRVNCEDGGFCRGLAPRNKNVAKRFRGPSVRREAALTTAASRGSRFSACASSPETDSHLRVG